MHVLLNRLRTAGRTRRAHLIFAGIVPTVCLLTMELLHRGTLWKGFFDGAFWKNFPSFGLTWLLLLAVYTLLCAVTRLPWLATLVVGLLTNLPGLVCYYKLQMRGEPFLPWDFSQIGDLLGVADKVSFQVRPFMLLALCIFALLLFCSCFLSIPKSGARGVKARLITAAVSAACGTALVCGVFLQPAVCQWFGIYSDMWMQDRYYRNYGVVTGFLTNLNVLNIAEPDGYSQQAIEDVEKQVAQKADNQKPLYADSYAATAGKPEKTPNIIFVMNESFWDASRLEGIEYDRPLTPNLTKLRNEAASGYVFSPSFGGGTCDVEFEALTGFSIEHLPAGCKPFQQHVTKQMFSLPQYLKSNGYETLAIHGYFAKFWNRNTAYPNLGIDTFIAAEDFKNPKKKRGFISDAAMTDRIIEEYEARTDEAPLFIHAVTMQNHTTYDEKRYPKDELVNVTKKPAGLAAETVSQLRDFATGVYEADAALGTLVDYFRSVDEPTIIVFWGDHFNPIGQGYDLYEATNYIQEGDITSPELRKTDLLIWSNYDDACIDLGTLASYNISPVMMELYGLEKPPYFNFLTQMLTQMRARTHGITVEPDNTAAAEMTKAQQKAFDTQWLLQYDLMFGKPYQPSFTAAESS